MRGRALLTVLIAAAALAGCGSDQSSSTAPTRPAAPHTVALSRPIAVSGPLVVGLADGASGWGGRTTALQLDRLIRGTGTGWLRDPFKWSVIEPSPGRFNFAYYDHYVLLAAQRGLHIVAQLVGAPGWAAPTAISLPADPTLFARYVAAVVGRYGPGGTFWAQHPSLKDSAITVFELWNEPYFDSGDGGAYNPGRYARTVKAAAIAGHAAAPSVRFLIEAEMEAHLNRVWTWWVDALYRAVPDLNRYFDGVAVHDFGTDLAHLAPIVANEPYPNFGRVRRIEDLRRQFLAHRAGRKAFWITETGWSTCAQLGCVTPSEQAANLTTLFGYLRTKWRNWVQAVFVYRYQDGTEPNSAQGGYGLVYRDGRPKPALGVFKRFTGGPGR
jgi:polysaccharide biosynthesis protein PslG